MAKEISEKKEMKKWEYFRENAGFCFISNNEDNRYFVADYESDAKWLTDKLNSLEEIKRFDDGIMLTDDGDLVKFVQQDYNDISHWYITPMKKPVITLSKPHAFFLRDGVVISDDEARYLWDEGTAEWSQGAFQKMARMVMA